MSDTASRLAAEGLIDLKRAAAEFKADDGRKPHLATLRRWATRGCRGHKLESMFVGNRMMTSRQATARFLAAINGAPPPEVASDATPNAAAERAGRELGALLK